MKDKSSIPAFAWHVCSFEAAKAGGDFETDMAAVVAGVIEAEGDPVMHSFITSDLRLSDGQAASQGMYTEAFMAFWRCVAQRMENPPYVLLQSMHSGSSDYFTKGMLASLLEPANEA